MKNEREYVGPYARSGEKLTRIDTQDRRREGPIGRDDGHGLVNKSKTVGRNSERKGGYSSWVKAR